MEYVACHVKVRIIEEPSTRKAEVFEAFEAQQNGGSGVLFSTPGTLRWHFPVAADVLGMRGVDFGFADQKCAGVCVGISRHIILIVHHGRAGQTWGGGCAADVHRPRGAQSQAAA